MQIDLLTRQDLENFKNEFLKEFRQLISESSPNTKQYLRSTEVCGMLSISPSSLQNMRNSGNLPYSKVEGTIFYKYSDIVEMLARNRVDYREYL